MKNFNDFSVDEIQKKIEEINDLIKKLPDLSDIYLSEDMNEIRSTASVPILSAVIDETAKHPDLREKWVEEINLSTDRTKKNRIIRDNYGNFVTVSQKSKIECRVDFLEFFISSYENIAFLLQVIQDKNNFINELLEENCLDEMYAIDEIDIEYDRDEDEVDEFCESLLRIGDNDEEQVDGQYSMFAEGNKPSVFWNGGGFDTYGLIN